MMLLPDGASSDEEGCEGVGEGLDAIGGSEVSSTT